MGTRLWLSMIYGFAQQPGDQARICSGFGHGVMVCLYLPRPGRRSRRDDVNATRSAP